MSTIVMDPSFEVVEILLVEDLFKVAQVWCSEEEKYYRFNEYDISIHMLLIDWGNLNPWYIIDKQGYSKEQIIKIIKFFRKRDIVLSLETELWIAKNDRI